MIYRPVVSLLAFVVVALAMLGNVRPTAAQFEAAGFDEPINLTAEFKLEEGKRSGKLIVTAEVPKKHYMYSLTQKKVPPPTRIVVTKSEQYKVSGKFAPNKKPVVIEHDELFDNRIEKHFGKISFIAPIQLGNSVEPKDLEIPMLVSGQVCSDDTCTPFNKKKVVARFGGHYKSPDKKKQ